MAIPYNPSRFETVADAIEQLMAEGGMKAVTMRAIAERSRVSLGTLSQEYGGRDRMLALTAAKCGERRLWRIQARSRVEHLAAFLPDTDDETTCTRVWLTWCTLARSDSQMARFTGSLLVDERSLVHVLTRRTLDAPSLDLLVAVLTGLNTAVCAPSDPMPRDRARTALDHYVEEHALPPPWPRL